ncbi:MAG: M14 family zinc carboxypeptidase, partial [Calditrichaceae bacterium]
MDYPLSSDHEIGASYHNYDAVSFILDSLAELYSEICMVENLGQTVKDRSMWSVLITDSIDSEEAEPEVKYVANMHGDELLSQEMMLFFIQYLLQNYESDYRIEKLVNTTEIRIVPNMNFDGSQQIERFNADGYDLNRNFPDRDPGFENPDPLQPETQHII